MKFSRQILSLLAAAVLVPSIGLFAQAPVQGGARPAEHSAARPAPARGLLAERINAILAEPSLYQEAILLLRRRGLEVGDAAARAQSAAPHVECEALTTAWAEVYRDPAHHWDLYELAEKLIDFEDYFRRWRFNHVTTVERIIGLKRGTGGTSGVGYLKRMLEIELFPELWRVRTRM